MDNRIYGMKLHQEIWLEGNNERVTRVPGGWIYVFYLDPDRAVSQFVPFNNEFMADPNEPDAN